MASKYPAVARAVIDYANACKDPSKRASLDAARANLAAARIEDCIEREVAKAPSLSRETRARLARLLADGGVQ